MSSEDLLKKELDLNDKEFSSTSSSLLEALKPCKRFSLGKMMELYEYSTEDGKKYFILKDDLNKQLIIIRDDEERIAKIAEGIVSRILSQFIVLGRGKFESEYGDEALFLYWPSVNTVKKELNQLKIEQMDMIIEVEKEAYKIVVDVGKKDKIVWAKIEYKQIIPIIYNILRRFYRERVR